MPINKAPSVCPVTGTGDPGIGSAICAMIERKKTPPITRATFACVVLRAINTERKTAGDVLDMRAILPSFRG